MAASEQEPATEIRGWALVIYNAFGHETERL